MLEYRHFFRVALINSLLKGENHQRLCIFAGLVFVFVYVCRHMHRSYIVNCLEDLIS